MPKFNYTLEAPELPAKKPIRLALREDDDGVMDLVSLDDEGHIDVFILGITPEGTLRRYRGVGSVCTSDEDEHYIKMDAGW